MCYKFIIPLHIADTNLYEVGWILGFSVIPNFHTSKAEFIADGME